MKYLHLFRHPSLWSRLLVAAALACAPPACVKPEEVNYVQNLVLDQKASIGKEYKIVIKKDDRLFISCIRRISKTGRPPVHFRQQQEPHARADVQQGQRQRFQPQG